LEVFPYFGFGGWIAQEIGGMVSGHQFSAAEIEPLTAELGDPVSGLQDGLGGSGAKADNDFGSDGVNLSRKKRRTLPHFVFLGLAIFRRAAFHDVADVDVFALQTHGFNHLGEQFSGAAYERKALHIFVVAGTLADENQFRFGVAVAKDDIVARGMKFASPAFAEIFANLEERVV
jgi:hypothetical protein